MKPYYWESQHGNFGDDLNLWLWDFLLPGFREVHPETLLVGVGTVLNRALLPEATHKLVIGSGFGYGTLPDMSDPKEWDIRSVRGPLTAAKVGVAPELGIIDPAVMVADLPEFQGLRKIYKRSFVPHWESAIAGLWPAICDAVGLNYIDPRGEAKDVIRKIGQSELVVAESMHGAILADAFRVPWTAVSTSHSINSFKWNDWAQTLGVTYRPRRVPVSTRAEAMIKGARFWGMDFQAKEPQPEDPNRRQIDGDLAVAEREPRQTSLRAAAKRALAAPATLALWQASRAAPQLSKDNALAERKERFRTVLDGIRRDYF
ncbi:polysaccharide pyruvyl transferase family protein [Sinorhizobium meliloti]|uniref:succinoglycan biosynthesis protein ExoV n=1 Tax=Rhizobium meliloti TaxID=382 RepID=UPI0002D9A0DD|nr:succinoglycan biosynthesis protein ExoV [Sinorhizobium meliloti]MDE4552265.1 succinoglycan biosynthesis protein ExoV [Sinorhizobium meliloti]RVG98316.1 polysaccharide pyruvyl transferase family protein [Sinorhizobium meliloti]RVH66202.1 polysaccharide pyruvyl transferase family protein [Sinorhizobium meliloti]RVL98560.1 polysaccharide pyruvyl transferase family protein [Sinorhizobium meliloti]RVN91087.1 polysaccharide pyruvyl transferase family protein [Sinorhizobium meliloti]